MLILELVMLLNSEHIWNENLFHGKKKPMVVIFRKIPKCVLLRELMQWGELQDKQTLPAEWLCKTEAICIEWVPSFKRKHNEVFVSD